MNLGNYISDSAQFSFRRVSDQTVDIVAVPNKARGQPRTYESSYSSYEDIHGNFPSFSASSASSSSLNELTVMKDPLCLKAFSLFICANFGKVVRSTSPFLGMYFNTFRSKTYIPIEQKKSLRTGFSTNPLQNPFGPISTSPKGNFGCTTAIDAKEPSSE